MRLNSTFKCNPTNDCRLEDCDERRPIGLSTYWLTMTLVQVQHWLLQTDSYEIDAWLSRTGLEKSVHTFNLACMSASFKESSNINWRFVEWLLLLNSRVASSCDTPASDSVMTQLCLQHRELQGHVQPRISRATMYASLYPATAQHAYPAY